MKAIPDDVLAAIKACHVTLKGPTTTPRKGDPGRTSRAATWPCAATSTSSPTCGPCGCRGRDRLDLLPRKHRGAYVLGSSGVNVTDDLAVDFAVTTTQGSERIIRLAFEHARKNKINKLTVVTKANVVKTTDGKFSTWLGRSPRSTPSRVDDWYIDIMTAKLVDPKRRTQFKVVVLPNLYGDILTDEAAEFQGGVGTAGSANIGKRYAMFEAIHGSAPRMVQEGGRSTPTPAA